MNGKTPPLWKTLLKALVFTVTAVVLSFYLPGPLTSLGAFIPKEKANDFSFSDFYALTASDKDAMCVDSTVTIIALDNCTRAQMGHAIAFADSSGSSAIGIDMIFSPPTSLTCDSIIQAIDTARNVVLPIVLTDPDENNRFTAAEVSYFDSLLEIEHDYGAVNINGNNDGSTTRFFKGAFEMNNGEHITSLASVLAEKHKPGSFQTLLERGNDMEMINFSGRTFNILSPDEMRLYPELLKDHIVLMGCVNNPADMHRNPLVNKMPGILIHANIISTIVDETYIDRSGLLVNLSVAFVTCFAMIFTRLYFSERKWCAMIVRIAQIILIITVLNIGSIAYAHWHYSFDFALTIIVSLLGLVVMDILTGLYKTIPNATKWVLTRLHIPIYNTKTDKSNLKTDD